MAFTFEAKFFSKAEFTALGENFTTFTNEYGQETLTYNHVHYYEDTAHGILFFIESWIVESAERRD